MTDDRAEMRAARDAGLKARHETRLARAQAAVPGAAIEAACDLTYLGQQLSENHARLILEAALPHLRPHETREARAIRREVAEEIAAAITAHRNADDSTREFRLGLSVGAKFAREIDSKEDG